MCSHHLNAFDLDFHLCYREDRGAFFIWRWGGCWSIASLELPHTVACRLAERLRDKRGPFLLDAFQDSGVTERHFTIAHRHLRVRVIPDQSENRAAWVEIAQLHWGSGRVEAIRVSPLLFRMFCHRLRDGIDVPWRPVARWRRRPQSMFGIGVL